MKRTSAGLLLVALSTAACASVYAPAVEQGAPQAPVRAGTAAPAVAPSPGAFTSDTAPTNSTLAPANTLQTRPMGDAQATTRPAQNAPAPAVPLSADRCSGPSSADLKVVPAACPPQ